MGVNRNHRKAEGSDFSEFAFRIEGMSRQHIRGCWSAKFEEVDWCIDRIHFKRLGFAEPEGARAFHDNLYDALSSLTIHFAVRFEEPDTYIPYSVFQQIRDRK